MADVVIGLALSQAPQRNAGIGRFPVPGAPGFVTLDTSSLFMAAFGFLRDEDGIKLSNVNPARVIPALGTIR
jgi:hypothetical protein